MNTIRVQLGERSYDIQHCQRRPPRPGAVRAERCGGAVAFVVSDEHVSPHADAAADALAAAGFRTAVSVLPSGEAQKSLVTAAHLYDGLAEIQADRRTLVVAVGGGVIGDLAGFVAATYNRGLPLLMVPTTLLAMVDSSVGGKVGVNHARGKNLIGAFHQPAGVWIDTAALATLPDREYRSGLAEVVKYGVILDAELFAWLERERRRRAAARPGGGAAHRRPELSFKGGRGGARRARDDGLAGGAELRPHVRPRLRDGGRLRRLAARRGGGGGHGVREPCWRSDAG